MFDTNLLGALWFPSRTLFKIHKQGCRKAFQRYERREGEGTSFGFPTKRYEEKPHGSCLNGQTQDIFAAPAQKWPFSCSPDLQTLCCSIAWWLNQFQVSNFCFFLLYSSSEKCICGYFLFKLLGKVFFNCCPITQKNDKTKCSSNPFTLKKSSGRQAKVESFSFKQWIAGKICKKQR